MQCDPFNPQDKGCPQKYSCQYTVAYQRYQCCGKNIIVEEEKLGVIGNFIYIIK